VVVEHAGILVTEFIGCIPLKGNTRDRRSDERRRNTNGWRKKDQKCRAGSMDGRWVISTPQMRSCTFGQDTAGTHGQIGYPKPGEEFGPPTREPVLEKLMGYAPIGDLGRGEHVAKLFIIAENEELFDNRDHAILKHHRATGIKKPVTVKGIKHDGMHNEKRQEAQQLALDWFDKHLKNWAL